jgi:GIY-YIG catalytic domain/NUMOD1 domain
MKNNKLNNDDLSATKNNLGVNKINGKSYVGSSTDLNNRLNKYYYSSSLNTKRPSIIHRALLKYGHSKFSLDILEYCESNILTPRKQYYIDLLKPEYNILKIASSKLGSRVNDKSKIITLEPKLKLSLRSHGVIVKVFDTSGNLINEFSTMTSVAKYFNLSVKIVGRYLDKNVSYNGFIFKSGN